MQQRRKCCGIFTLIFFALLGMWFALLSKFKLRNKKVCSTSSASSILRKITNRSVIGGAQERRVNDPPAAAVKPCRHQIFR